MAAESYICSICNHFTTTTMAAVLKHVGCVHAHEPNFHIVCGIQGCPRTYKNYHSFRKHLRRHHPDCMSSNETERVIATDDTIIDDVDCSMIEEVEVTEHAEETRQERKKSAALFVIKTKEVLNISQTATDQILNDVSDMMRNTVHHVERKVSCVLAANNITVGEELHKIFNEHLENPFCGLETQYAQQKYFRDHLGLVVRSVLLLLPVKIKLTECY